MVQNTEISKCNPVYEQAEKKNLLDAENAFDKLQHSIICYESPGEIMGTMDICKHNKGN